MPERIQRQTPSTLTFKFYVGGVLTDPDSNVATVTITRADGTALVTNASLTRVSAGVYRYSLAPQTNLNRLLANATGVFSGQSAVVPLEVEIVGGFYWTVAELRAWDASLVDTVKYPDDRVLAVRNQVETEFEDHCRRAFVLRYEREILTGDGTFDLWLRRAEPRNVIKLVVDGVDITSTVSLIADDEAKKLLHRRDDVWSQISFDNIVIEYEWGRQTPPPRIIEASMKRARGKLVASKARIDERATMMQIPDFGSFNLATAGKGGSITGIPEVDIVLEDYELACGGVA